MVILEKIKVFIRVQKFLWLEKNISDSSYRGSKFYLELFSTCYLTFNEDLPYNVLGPWGS